MDLQIGHVHRRISFFGISITEEALVGKGPSEQIRDDEDCSVWVRACNIGLVVCQFTFRACRNAVPLEPRETAVIHDGAGHDDANISLEIDLDGDGLYAKGTKYGA